MRRLGATAADDDGQILILALIFLLTVSFLVITPLALAWTSLSSSVSFQQQFKLQSTAQSAMDVAIDQFRVHQGDGLPGSGLATSPETCPLSGTQYDLTPSVNKDATWAPGPPVTYTANGYTVSVTCSGLGPPGVVLGSFGRRVSFSVSCVQEPAQAIPCPSGVLLGADVQYQYILGEPVSRNDTVKCSGSTTVQDASAVAVDVGEAVTFNAGSGVVPAGTTVASVNPGVSFVATAPIPASVTGLTLAQAIVVQYWSSGY